MDQKELTEIWERICKEYDFERAPFAKGAGENMNATMTMTVWHGQPQVTFWNNRGPGPNGRSKSGKPNKYYTYNLVPKQPLNADNKVSEKQVA